MIECLFVYVLTNMFDDVYVSILTRMTKLLANMATTLACLLWQNRLTYYLIIRCHMAIIFLLTWLTSGPIIHCHVDVFLWLIWLISGPTIHYHVDVCFDWFALHLWSNNWLPSGCLFLLNSLTIGPIIGCNMAIF